MRHKFNYRRRLRKSASYVLENEVRSKKRVGRARSGRSGFRGGVQTASRMPRSKARFRAAASAMN